MTCHNELRGGVTNLAGKSFTPLHVRENPLINPSCAVGDEKDEPAGLPVNTPPVLLENLDQKGDLLIRKL